MITCVYLIDRFAGISAGAFLDHHHNEHVLRNGWLRDAEMTCEALDRLLRRGLIERGIARL